MSVLRTCEPCWQYRSAGSWTADSADSGDDAKILMIAHRMAAKRMSFEQIYAAFQLSVRLRPLLQSLRDEAAARFHHALNWQAS
jgi:hypothetical protein